MVSGLLTPEFPMGFRRFAETVGLERISVTGIRFRTCLIAGGALTTAVLLSGCSAPRPFSVEEKLWFNKATGVYQPPGPMAFGYQGPSFFDPDPRPMRAPPDR
jgi:hypothetical protein